MSSLFHKKICQSLAATQIRLTSDSSDDGILDVAHVLNDINVVLGENRSDNEDSVQRQEVRRKKRDRMRPFYKKRRDVLEYFDDDKIRRTFRFDRVFIQFITGTFQTVVGNVLKVSHQASVSRCVKHDFQNIARIPGVAGVIVACCVLNKIALDCNQYLDEDEMEDLSDDDNDEPPDRRNENNMSLIPLFVT
ncbi:hypothetical protein DAPPUDRAFT_103833 [Daphnia pulex]|uniref:DDE Tnp4 domain-containing protein n=1 Tax=Daphnia pulex TaxID=6669 RepID=E9GKH1_DAPPU|nr:hypothetical protein DAPPUDRAFT_103833 [Daphnia pulex]|eukprot:EFX79991.1 hypothetical protein DAPPUDRAFT_103833 [Daphnia pulex]